MSIRCAVCSKRFTNDNNLTKHLNHPSTSCRPWQTDLVSIAEILKSSTFKAAGRKKTRDVSPEHSRMSQKNDGTTLDYYHDSGPVDDMDISMDDHEDVTEFSEAEDRMNSEASYSPQYSDIHIETHPKPPKLYKNGKTLMDIFTEDRFAHQRETNLYYPFASRDDWEIGSWLLQSGLSMKAIDKFLSLRLVSYRF